MYLQRLLILALVGAGFFFTYYPSKVDVLVCREEGRLTHLSDTRFSDGVKGPCKVLLDLPLKGVRRVLPKGVWERDE